MKIFFLSATLTTTFHLVTSHGGVWNYTIDGKFYAGETSLDNLGRIPVPLDTSIQRTWSTIDPILDTQSPFLSCNSPSTPAPTALHAPISPGGLITANWNPWVHEIGPSFVYLASCGDSCTPLNTSELLWFKISEVGLINGTWANGFWGNTILYNGGTQDVTIPKGLKRGKYMVRHELIPIHTNVQHFVECAQLEVLGEGTESPGSEYLVKFPGGYQDDNPGIMNPHDAAWFFADNGNRTDYPIPGPKIWRGLD